LRPQRGCEGHFVAARTGMLAPHVKKQIIAAREVDMAFAVRLATRKDNRAHRARAVVKR
jgi:hypothetical protein